MPRIRSASAVVLAITLTTTGPASAQSSPAPTPPASPAPQSVPRVDAAIAQALLANPATAPYRFTIVPGRGRVTLRGRVGSKAIHDVAIRTVIPFGLTISDELVIDTTEAYRVASIVSASAPTPAAIVSSYTYPPPLFGRFDDPFFGLEPPLITYPTWWGDVKDGRLRQAAQAATERAIEPPLPPPGAVEMTIDPFGVALIRGLVPTEADRIDIGQRLALSPGVSRVINRLIVDPAMIGPAANPNPAANPSPRPARRDDDVPPPPPTPAPPRPEPATAPIVPDAAPAPAPAPAPIVPDAAPAPTPAPRVPAARLAPAGAGDGLLARLDRAIQDRPELAGKGVSVASTDGVVTLSGEVPGVVEAMLAYRAVQQTPGVREVVDTLRFVVPDGSSPNPLLKAKADDVEPYLEAQVRRQVGDAAHVDRVRLTGEHLEIRGTIDRADDRARVEAILRSMPILRGFTLLPEFRPTGG